MMLVDIFEPDQIEKLLSQSIPGTSKMALNTKGYADYLWHAIDGHIIQVERKQIDEILGDMDGVEEQLRRELVKAEETILIYEGTFESVPGVKTACQSYRKTKDGKLMVPGHKYNTSYLGIMAWFSQLDKSGITVIHTIDYVATATTLIALYNNSQKLEHTTFKRYIKQRIYPVPFNPYVETMMGVKGAELGEKKAKALIDRYITPWQIFNQDVEELAKTEFMGVQSARKLLKSIGREI